MRLEFPDDHHEKRYTEMIQNWSEYEKTPTSPGRIFGHKNYKEFLQEIQNDTTQSSRGVNSHLFFGINTDNEIVGAIQIRHHINHPNLIESGGHIGYGITPNYRRKGYGKHMLALGLQEATKIGIEKVLITCDKENVASAKIIKQNGGVFERIGEKDGELVQRYWIDI